MARAKKAKRDMIEDEMTFLDRQGIVRPLSQTYDHM